MSHYYNACLMWGTAFEFYLNEVKLITVAIVFYWHRYEL